VCTARTLCVSNAWTMDCRMKNGIARKIPGIVMTIHLDNCVIWLAAVIYPRAAYHRAVTVQCNDLVSVFCLGRQAE
jgi:hypothetical protein